MAFDGPLFVVGNPRSGTKLLRDLLNRSPEISLCNPETHFIPYLYRKHGGRPGAFEADLDALFADLDRTPFQVFSRRMGRPTMRRGDLDALQSARDWGEAFEAILRFNSDPPDRGARIWGDKTPSYVREMPLLKEIFPAARFVHILRDPRDVALSAHAAWGHNLHRVAAKWAGNVAAARRDAPALGPDYEEVVYEELLGDPEGVLRAVCGFVECRFDPEMTTLLRPSENIGEARGKRFIDAANRAKYRHALAPAVQRRIEEIVFPDLEGTPYRAEIAQGPVPLSPLATAALTLSDGGRSAVRYLRRKGLVQGLRIAVGNRIQKRRRFTR